MITDLTRAEQLTLVTSLDEWSKLGTDLYTGADKLTWALADWANFGEAKWGALKTWCDAHRASFAKLKELAVVAAALPPEARNQQLTFGHHFEVFGLSPKEQQRWLRQAHDKKWTASELRQQLRDSLGERSALISDGPGLKLPTKGLADTIAFVTHQPREFWTESSKTFWRGQLKPLVDWYNANL